MYKLYDIMQILNTGKRSLESSAYFGLKLMNLKKNHIRS